MVSTLISSVSGVVEAVGPDWVDVALGGITLRVSVPGSTASGVGAAGDAVRMHTSLQVREDSLTLYGFLSDEERLTFDTLLGINGVGPRLALAVLSRFAPSALAAAVDAADTAALSTVSGVGKRTASRKLDLDFGGAAAGPVDIDALDALVALGYSDTEARQALAALPADGAASMEDRVRDALQHLAGV